jgi:hypothetical protein
MKKSTAELYQSLLTKMQEDAAKELMGIDSRTLDSLLCNSCLDSGNPQQCSNLMQFKNSADGSKSKKGEIGNMIYLHRICGYTLAEYQRNQEKK